MKTAIIISSNYIVGIVKKNILLRILYFEDKILYEQRIFANFLVFCRFRLEVTTFSCPKNPVWEFNIPRAISLENLHPVSDTFKVCPNASHFSFLSFRVIDFDHHDMRVCLVFSIYRRVLFLALIFQKIGTAVFQFCLICS